MHSTLYNSSMIVVDDDDDDAVSCVYLFVYFGMIVPVRYCQARASSAYLSTRFLGFKLLYLTGA